MKNNPSEFIKNDKFANFLGVELVNVEKNNAVVKMKLKEEHLNSHGTVQ